ncbi:hypothetical protein HDV00_012270 [Rhizophlyctis rosea]|nr:hypothetical protein HDV00_012270 [Rhizophlyctis rosea]
MQAGQGRRKPSGKSGGVTNDIQRKLLKAIQEFEEQIGDSSKQWDEDAFFKYILSPGSRHYELKRLGPKKLSKLLQELPKQEKDDESDEFDEEFAFQPDVPLMEVKDTNFMNRHLSNLYQKQNPPSSPRSSPLAPPSSNVIATDPSSTPEPPKVDDTQPTRTSTPDVTTEEGRKRRQKASGGGESKKAKTSLATLQAKYPPPTTRLADLGGLDQPIGGRDNKMTLEEIVLQLIVMTLQHAEIPIHLGTQPPRGVLLHGPPGCGKTTLAHAIAGEAGVPFISISAPSVVSGMSGESEKKIREVFDEAKEAAPCLLFIDEIDAITPKRESSQRGMEQRIVAQLLTCMDDLSLEKTNNKPVIVIGATNRPDSLDAALRRAGRFDREISMGVPDERARESILKKLLSKLKLAGDFDLKKLAKQTPGYVGADLNALTTEAGQIAVNRSLHSLRVQQAQIAAQAAQERAVQPVEVQPTGNDLMEVDGAQPEASFSSNGPLTISTNGVEHTPSDPMSLSEFLQARREPLTEDELAPLCITFEDFLQAKDVVQPSAKREGFATVPDVTWDDIGGLSTVRDELMWAIVQPIRDPELYATYGITAPQGVLLYGPPGCGKTLYAKAIANDSHCNFISVKGPELLNKYVGESERSIREVFTRAAASYPCIIFFDELDALCPARSNDADSQQSSRLVNTLLTEMDGMSSRKQVYVMAATNRPDMIDPAMLRPGRLDKALYLDFPDSDQRFDILKKVCRNKPLENVDLRAVADDERCDGLSGADLAALGTDAAVMALKSRSLVRQEHFESALRRVTPSVSKKDRDRYRRLRDQFSKTEL